MNLVAYHINDYTKPVINVSRPYGGVLFSSVSEYLELSGEHEIRWLPNSPCRVLSVNSIATLL